MPKKKKKVKGILAAANLDFKILKEKSQHLALSEQNHILQTGK